MLTRPQSLKSYIHEKVYTKWFKGFDGNRATKKELSGLNSKKTTEDCVPKFDDPGFQNRGPGI